MAVNQWIIGRTEPIIARWFRNGSEVVSGSATVTIKTDIGGVFYYALADGTITTTPTTHALTYDALHGWLFEIVPGLAMLGPNSLGQNFLVEVTHSDPFLPLLVETNVVSNDARPGATVR